MTLLIFLAAALTYISAHELCFDTSGPIDATLPMLGVCRDYGYSRFCCTKNVTSLIPQIKVNSSSKTCKQLVQGLACSRCDAWGAHLYGLEANIIRDIPYLCGEFCKTLYHHCKDAVLSDPSRVLFSQDVRFDIYESEEAFCREHNASASHSPQYCYNGTAFVAHESTPVQLTTSLCLPKVLERPDSSMILDMHPIPRQEDMQVLVRRSGLVEIIQKITRQNGILKVSGLT